MRQAYVKVDTTGNLWPGTVTIADLAANTEILETPSERLSIYQVQEAFAAEWRFEIADWEYEYGNGYSARFKDGSAIYVGAERTEPRDDQWDD